MTKDEILSRLLSDISDEFDKGVGSFFYDVTKPASEEFEMAYARLEEILKNGFALTASGEYLDFKAAEGNGNGKVIWNNSKAFRY